LINIGYFGFSLNKSYLNGDEMCLTAYTKLVVNGYVVLALQFSDFFGYYVASSINEVRLDIDISGKYILSIWQNKWILVSEHKYISNAIEVKNILDTEDIKKARSYVDKMDIRINKNIK
jgi:hypothetical protein